MKNVRASMAKTPRLWHFLLSSFIAQTIASATVVTIPVILPLTLALPLAGARMHAEKGGQADMVHAIGQYVALLYLAAALTALSCGTSLVQRHRRTILFVALAACGLGVVLAQGAAAAWLFASAIVVGLGYGPLTPLNSQVVAEYTDKRRGLTLSLRQAGVPLGAMLAGVTFPALYSAGGTWGVFLPLLLACLLSGLAVAVFCPTAQPRAPVTSPRSNGLLPPRAGSLRKPTVIALIVIASIFAGAQMCFASYLVAYLIIDQKMPIARAATLLSAAGVGGLACRVIWGAWSDAIDDSRMVLVGNAFSICIAAWLLGPGYAWLTPTTLWLVVLLFGGNAYGWNGVYLAALSDAVPVTERARVFGISTFLTYLGVVIWPSMFAGVSRHYASMVPGFTMLASIAMVACLILAYVIRHDKRAS